MRHDPVALGVDGGGTRSEARLWSGGREVARALGGALNPNHAGVAGSARALRALLAALGAHAGRPTGWVADAACVGLSGVSHPSSGPIVREAFETAGVTVSGPRVLISDAEILLEAAFGTAAPSGVVVIAGTGSVAMARDAAGRLVRAGGLGPLAGDPGSAHWIGTQAVARGWAEPPPGGPAALAPAVAAAAGAGDRGALAILAGAAEALCDLAVEAARAAGAGPAVDVRPAGGVARRSDALRELLAAELARRLPGARLLPPVDDPLAGALAIATRALEAGRDVPPGW
jgi:N-acetylglucosamine kinase-like BadF-type ATPase